MHALIANIRLCNPCPPSLTPLLPRPPFTLSLPTNCFMLAAVIQEPDAAGPAAAAAATRDKEEQGRPQQQQRSCPGVTFVVDVLWADIDSACQGGTLPSFGGGDGAGDGDEHSQRQPAAVQWAQHLLSQLGPSVMRRAAEAVAWAAGGVPAGAVSSVQVRRGGAWHRRERGQAAAAPTPPTPLGPLAVP